MAEGYEPKPPIELSLYKEMYINIPANSYRTFSSTDLGLFRRKAYFCGIVANNDLWRSCSILFLGNHNDPNMQSFCYNVSENNIHVEFNAEVLKITNTNVTFGQDVSITIFG